MKTAKIFKNGQSQAIRLPKEFRFEGSDVYVRKQGDGIVLYPTANVWKNWLANLNRFSADFMTDRHQLPMQKRDQL